VAGIGINEDPQSILLVCRRKLWSHNGVLMPAGEAGHSPLCGLFRRAGLPGLPGFLRQPLFQQSESGHPVPYRGKYRSFPRLSSKPPRLNSHLSGRHFPGQCRGAQAESYFVLDGTVAPYLNSEPRITIVRRQAMQPKPAPTFNLVGIFGGVSQSPSEIPFCFFFVFFWLF
jgi:hypothetical protein